MRLRYGIHLPSFADPNVLVGLAVEAERHGWDGYPLWAHVLAIVLRTDGDELVPVGVDEVAELRRSRTAEGGFELAVVSPGLPEDPGAYADAGATWVLVTGWLDDLPRIARAAQ